MNIHPKGNLSEHSLPKILYEMYRARATGTLTVSTELTEKKIYLKEGNVISASSGYEDDRLGEILVKAGKISMEQYDTSVELLKKTGKRQGAILIEQGYITPRDFIWGVKFQVKEIIYSLFHLENGTYELFEDTVFPDDIVPLTISMENLIYEGVKRVENLTKIRSELPDLSTVLQPNEPEEVFKGIDLSTQDRTILSLVDGKRTIKQILEEAHMNSFEVMRTLYILLTTAFITEKEIVDAQYNDTVNMKEIFDSMRDDEKELRQEIETFYEKLQKMSKAEILMVNEHSTAGEIKKNYYRLVRDFHPDRVHSLHNEELKRKASAIFDAVSKAYTELKDDVRRRDYFNALGKAAGQREDTDDALIKEQFMRGVEAFKDGNYWGAAEDFRWVTRREPKNPKAWSYLSLALSKVPKRAKEAEEAILEAIRLEPFNGEHFANLGLLYLSLGMKTRARHQFEKSLRFDPQNFKARKGLEEANQPD